jgi:hypothetical protein
MQLVMPAMPAMGMGEMRSTVEFMERLGVRRQGDCRHGWILEHHDQARCNGQLWAFTDRIWTRSEVSMTARMQARAKRSAIARNLKR